MSSSNYFRSWIDRPHLDPNTRLLTEEYQRGITEFMGLVHRQPEAKTGIHSTEYTEGLIPRNIPRDSFLGIYRGTRSSEFSEGSVPRKFPMKIPRNISSELPRIGPSESPSESPSKYPEEVLPRYIPRSFPTNWWSSEFPRKFVFSEFRRKIPREFRRKMNFRGVISEDLFRRYVVGITLFRRHINDFFPQYVAVFL
ncbi:hypothetical protein DY000_02024980 [Brassica cretica]|uniref:Uncharacterized protein n=1 Tax=Brassica cretica TaxID=69181 RepID=A0ABQ7E401_BRACR|nr:hypothetical protein DY000_02024980 [Brassica cretica]